jgi:hypothetical protein
MDCRADGERSGLRRQNSSPEQADHTRQRPALRWINVALYARLVPIQPGRIAIDLTDRGCRRDRRVGSSSQEKNPPCTRMMWPV